MNNNILFDLNQDVYSIIYTYLSYFPFTSMRMCSHTMYYKHTKEIYSKLNFYNGVTNKILHVMYPNLSKV